MAEKQILTERGRRAAVERYGADAEERIVARYKRMAEQVDEDWSRLFTDFVTNGMYARGVLPTSLRELCAVAALTVLQRKDELRAHIQMALRTNPPEQVREAILQMSVYGGMPVALEGLRLYEEVMAEPEFAPRRSG